LHLRPKGIWQANAHGRYAHPMINRTSPSRRVFKACRIPTVDDGSFRFKTIKPGRVPRPDGKLQAPHIVVSFFSRGLLRRLVTRIYFPDDEANSADYALNLVEPGRRHTLIAKKSAKREGVLEWNVVPQGSDETVFFDC
jgi:protocatechuate 3,4-dioxygenase alpha subunit